MPDIARVGGFSEILRFPNEALPPVGVSTRRTHGRARSGRWMSNATADRTTTIRVVKPARHQNAVRLSDTGLLQRFDPPDCLR
jgi:hypothetical protein